jgi:hypothetical protein
LTSQTIIIVGVGILIFETGILSIENLRKLKSIITILFEAKNTDLASKAKRKRQAYTNLPIPDELPFEIRISPESKTVLNMPNWITTAIPVFRFGHKKFQTRNKSSPTDQTNTKIIKELLNASNLKGDKDNENFIIDLEDLKNLEKEFME